MKLRTFIFTLILFLLFFYGGILLFSIISLRSSLDGAKERALGEHYFIVTSFAGDLLAVEAQAKHSTDEVDTFFQFYSFYYQKQSVFLEMYEEKKVIHSAIPTNMKTDSAKYVQGGSDRTVFFEEIGGKQYLGIAGSFPTSFEQYALVYYFDLEPVMSGWTSLTRTLFVAGLILSVILAIVLYIVIANIFKPWGQIALASESIAAGDYHNKIEIKGTHELSQVADSFNNMADEIQNQMGLLLDAADQKQQFVDNLAHELRTPLTSIYGYAEYIQKTNLADEDKIDATEYIMSESERLKKISNRLLDLATFRDGEMEYQSVNFPLLIEDIEKRLCRRLKEKSMVIKRDLCIEMIYGDRYLLESLFSNLFDNAIKACHMGGFIYIRSYEDENGNRIVEVEDTGRGIPQEAIYNLTDAFYRVDKARDRAAGGAGLGLALCAQIVRRHEGQMSFDSEPGRGTTVTIEFARHFQDMEAMEREEGSL